MCGVHSRCKLADAGAVDVVAGVVDAAVDIDNAADDGSVPEVLAPSGVADQGLAADQLIPQWCWCRC